MQKLAEKVLYKQILDGLNKKQIQLQISKATGSYRNDFEKNNIESLIHWNDEDIEKMQAKLEALK